MAERQRDRPQPIVHAVPRCEIVTVTSRDRRRPISSFGGSDDAQSRRRIAARRTGHGDVSTDR